MKKKQFIFYCFVFLILLVVGLTFVSTKVYASILTSKGGVTLNGGKSAQEFNQDLIDKLQVKQNTVSQQYSKHKLISLTIFISVLVIIVVSLIIWRRKSTHQFKKTDFIIIYMIIIVLVSMWYHISFDVQNDIRNFVFVDADNTSSLNISKSEENLNKINSMLYTTGHQVFLVVVPDSELKDETQKIVEDIFSKNQFKKPTLFIIISYFEKQDNILVSFQGDESQPQLYEDLRGLRDSMLIQNAGVDNFIDSATTLLLEKVEKNYRQEALKSSLSTLFAINLISFGVFTFLSWGYFPNLPKSECKEGKNDIWTETKNS